MELSRLTSEDRTVPLVVEKLINYIEMHGLYTEGIYRKSGSTNKIKELRQGLDTGKIVPSKSRPNTFIQIDQFMLLKFSLHVDLFVAARRMQSFLWCLFIILLLSKETLFLCGQFSKH